MLRRAMPAIIGALIVLASPGFAAPNATRCLGCGSPPPLTSTLYGFVSHNTTLTYTAPGPVYDVIGDIVVNAGVTLTVEPGVTLRFAANHDTLAGGDYPALAELLVRGNLVADASAGDSIRFVCADGGVAAWGQIRAESNLNLRNVVIQGARRAIYGVAGIVALRSVRVIDSDDGFRFEGAVGTVQECAITGHGVGTGLFLRGIDTTPPDTSSVVSPTIVAGFATGVELPIEEIARNIVARDNTIGFSGGGRGTFTYCTGVRNGSAGFFYAAKVVNSIVAWSNSGVLNGFVDYTDAWANATNFVTGSVGQNTASFDPFFVDPGANDFRLGAGSIFKQYSSSGGEIGAYGPVCGQSVAGIAGGREEDRLSAFPNPTRGEVVLGLGSGQGPMAIYDLNGRVVRTYEDVAGSLRWDGRSDVGSRVSDGVYFWRVAGSRTVGRVVVVQ